MKKAAWLMLLAMPMLLHAASASEDEMFGGDEKPAKAEASKATPAPTPEGKDDAGMDTVKGEDAFSRGDTKENPLDIGGDIYQRAYTDFQRGLTEGEQPFNLPLQVDLYLDGRPNDRVRTYVMGRLLYDSTKDAYGRPTSGTGGFPVLPTAITPTATPTANNPQVVLDQAWIKFDLGRTVFFSLGRQHVKWGTGRLWNPSDALNPQRRDPLQPYDLRLGADMLTVQVPWEKQQANLYGIVLFDNPQPASTLQQLGGAVRMEGLVGPAEIGLSAVGRPGTLPRYSADLSTPLGPFDFYSEAAFLSNDGSLGFYEWHGIPAGPSPSINQLYSYTRLPGSALQIVGGLEYTGAWRENRQATVALEYFYNELGSSDGHIYPILLYYGAYTPFYLGRHYAALALRAEGPDSGKRSSYNLSTLANLDDKSAVTRLDVTYLLHDNLTIGAWGSINYGASGGEFNFTLDTPALSGGPAIPVQYAGSSGEAGLSLRMSY
jgi:hypothetical protein